MLGEAVAAMKLLWIVVFLWVAWVTVAIAMLIENDNRRLRKFFQSIEPDSAHRGNEALTW